MSVPSSSRHALSRRAVLAAAGIGTLGAVVGCSRGTLTQPAPAGVVTLNNDNPTWAPGLESASGVLQERVGVELQIRANANTSNYQQIVRTSALTDATTDLVKWWNGYRLHELVHGDVLTDLSQAWDRAEREGWVDHELRASFSEGGVPYGMPLYRSYFAMFYSKQVFDQHGLQPPETFPEFLDIARTLRDANVVPIAATGASSWESLTWFQQLVAGIDPDFYEAVTEGQAKFTDPVAEQAMELWVEMYADQLFSSPDIDGSGIAVQLADGSCGMSLSGTWLANSFRTAGVGPSDVGVFLVPPVDPAAEESVFVESGALCVPANAHKHDQALEVAEHWLSTDVQQAWIDFLADVSANPSAIPTDSVVTDFAQEMRGRSPRQLIRYWEASPPALIEGNVQDLSSFMVTPTQANAGRTLASMQERSEREWEVWNG